MPIVTPVAKSDLNDLGPLFDATSLDEVWDEFDEEYSRQFLNILHRHQYSLRLIAPLIPVKRFSLSRSSVISRQLTSAEILSALDGSFDEAVHSQELRLAIEEMADISQWENCLLSNALVRESTKSDIVGRVMVNLLRSTDIAELTRVSRTRRDTITGVSAHDIVIHHLSATDGFIRFKTLETLNMSNVTSILNQGLYDLDTFIVDANQHAATMGYGHFYFKVPEKKANEHLQEFKDALATFEEEKEFEDICDDPTILHREYEIEIPLIGTLDII